MTLIRVICFNLLLITVCLAANIDRESSHNDAQTRNRTENVSKVGVENEVFDYAMYENFDLVEMLQAAKDSQYSEYVIKHIFPVKYLNYEFFIIANMEENFMGEKEDIASRNLNIYGYDFYTEVIQYFGASMKKLNIQNTNWIDDDLSAALHRHVNKYCADSLIQLNLANIKENVLTQYKNPFSKLTDLYISIRNKQTQPVRSFGELFPELRFLSIVFDNDAESNEFIETEMPNLQQLEIYSYERDHPTLEKTLENMFQKNPQIRRMFYNVKLGDFIQVINKYLRNLEHLEISSLCHEIQPAKLDHVKHLSIGSNDDSPIDRLTIPQLESLKMNYYQKNDGGVRDSFIKFFKNHQHLKEINCTISDQVGSLVGFFEELPNLTTIRFKSYYNFEIDLVSGLIENHKNLMELEYQVSSDYYPNAPALQPYCEKFGTGWNITYSKDAHWLTIKLQAKN